MASVDIFNACPEPVTLEINAGEPLTVPATGDTSNWAPQRPKKPVAWTERDQTVGGFHYGSNKIRMYREGQSRVHAQEPAIEIETTGEQVNSLQLYLFWHSGTDLAWLFLRDGKPIQVSETMLTVRVHIS